MIRAIEHIGIAVRSIEEARPFYESLGLAIERIEEVPGEGVRVAFVPCGHTRFELLEPTRPDSPIAKFLERRGPGVHHVCLESDAIGDDDTRLRRCGMELLRTEPTIGAGGARVQFIHPKSSGGILMEISEPAAHPEPAEERAQ
ncbi:MAG TPA: methylmalonyl-CoA epimerase [Thermoanaerobaculia bacterium]|nr:methylmalonyl-CoA epimerase [Thermoanaerobaculia bacterium]